MKKPEMIIFDYGHTLLYEPDSNSLRGEEALFKYIKSNKNNLTPQQVNDYAQDLFENIGLVRKMNMEIHERQFQRMLYEYLEIELTISLEEAELVFWDGMSSGATMPDSDKLIDYINANGIRSGVISNIGFSGDALTERLNRLLPRNKFEFVIASSEYMFRKPNRMLFELALKKAGLSADEVWFCGDNVIADIGGSSSVGIFPVWYDNNIKEDSWTNKNDGVTPQCEHLHIHEWSEMIDILKGLE
jgi:haloacid dehalogenase superfamily, subfamily IA, variant 1 with third motif having Dx(3-4)D or Dx(3-4)E